MTAPPTQDKPMTDGQKVEPLTDDERAEMRGAISHARSTQFSEEFDRGKIERLLSNNARFAAKALHLAATIEQSQAEYAALTARLDHPMLDPSQQPVPANDPALLAELAALSSEKLCERLRGIYALWEGAAPRQFYTGAISHEAARRIEAAEAKLNPQVPAPTARQQFGRNMAKGHRSCDVCGRSWTWVGRDGECGGTGPTLRARCPMLAAQQQDVPN